MIERRRDSKNRVLRNGESQEKSGQYRYKYTDSRGNVKYERSWRLVRTDVTPPGKKDKPPLRETIKVIQKDLLNGICSVGGEMTVVELVERYISQKTGVRRTGLVIYK
jgi:hypothetical protein